IYWLSRRESHAVADRCRESSSRHCNRANSCWCVVADTSNRESTILSSELEPKRKSGEVEATTSGVGEDHPRFVCTFADKRLEVSYVSLSSIKNVNISAHSKATNCWSQCCVGIGPS